MTPTTCVWFRKGLRVHDNAALVEAAAGSGSVLPLYVLDPYFARPEFVGAPRYRFLLESLADDQRKRLANLVMTGGARPLHSASESRVPELFYLLRLVLRLADSLLLFLSSLSPPYSVRHVAWRRRLRADHDARQARR